MIALIRWEDGFLYVVEIEGERAISATMPLHLYPRTDLFFGDELQLNWTTLAGVERIFWANPADGFRVRRAHILDMLGAFPLDVARLASVA